MRYDIRNNQQLRRLLLLSGLVLLSALVLGGLFGRSARQAVAGASTQELGKLNRFIQNSDGKGEAMKVFRQGRDQIEDENWNGAAATFTSFVVDYPKHKDVDAALYWTAFALKKQGKYAEADMQLERLIRERPRSNWLDDARAMRVEIASQTGNRQVVERELDKNDQEIKLIALQSLFQSNPDRAAAFVADLFKPGSTADRRMKETVITLLGQHSGPSTTPLLLEQARNQTDPKLRKTAIFWLGRNSDESVLDLLKEAAQSPDTEVTGAAIFALKQHRSPRASEFLLELARGASSPETRRNAIFWIGQRHTDAAADDLMKIYEVEKDVEIKKQILFALSQNRSPSARAKLSETASSGGDVELRKQAIFGLSQLRDEASVIETLAQMYDSEKNNEVKEQLIFAFKQSSQKTGLRKLMQIAKGDASVEMRKKAIFWLGQSRDPEAVKFIEEILK